jgi:hypothetical protein
VKGATGPSNAVGSEKAGTDGSAGSGEADKSGAVGSGAGGAAKTVDHNESHLGPVERPDDASYA